MKRFVVSEDLLLLKWPVLLLIFCILASGTGLAAVFQLRKQMTHAMQAAQTNRDQMASMVQQIEGEGAIIRSYVDRYRQLQADGSIGAEDRLVLVDTIGRLRSRYKLYPVQLDLGPQAEIPLVGGEAENVGTWLSLRSSRIHISLSLLHEEDLSRLVAGLQHLGRGMFVVEECSVSRASSEALNDALKLHENLTASCSLLWLTLTPEEGQPDDGSTPPQPGGGA